MAPTFEQAYEDNVDRVYGFLAYRVGTRADAEDLTQLTFERALRNWHRYDAGRASPATWFISIARNALIDHHRRSGPRERVSLSHGDIGEGELPSIPGPDESLGLGAELATALDGLRIRDREIVALRFGADLSISEIARTMDLSVSNVQQILSRTLRRLRRSLEGEPEGAVRARRRNPRSQR
jgi:RNA polymerase sigma factor (sigma-70 family)